MPKANVLYLSGLGWPRSAPFQEKLLFLSRHMSGDVIFSTSEKGAAPEIKEIGGFRLHPYRYVDDGTIKRNFTILWKSLSIALKIRFSGRKYQAVVSSTPFVTGLAAIIISLLTGAKAVVEINGNFESAYKYDSKDGFGGGLLMKLKHRISRSWIGFVVRRADAVKLVYSRQLEPLGIDAGELKRVCSFANFVPISSFIAAEKADKGYVLLLGYPWLLKGVDILIKAFRKISPEFPGLKLKVVGWCPSGREYFENLAEGNSNIELCDPVYYDEVITLMAECSLYVLASRTDSSPRVLREAMAAGKPIIASDIDGVPEIIKDGYNGLLFEKENVDDLAGKMRMVLSRPELAKQLTDNGMSFVREHLSEECYARNYGEMIKKILG